MEIFDKIKRYSKTATQGLKVKSVLNPILWLCGIASPLCFTAAYFLKDITWIHVILVIVGLLPIIIGCFSFLYFIFSDPNKLQSEDFQLKHETLQIIQTKSGEVKLDSTSLDKIALGSDPSSKQIEGKDDQIKR